MDIVDIHERSGEMLGEVCKRLDDAVKEHGDKVDMLLLLEVMEDLVQGKFTTGDLAAVYTYRLGKRAQS